MFFRREMITKKIKPTKLIFFFFILLILCGSFLLSLPLSSAIGERTPFIDALFMSASALCVVGLSLFNTATYWSPFGKIVILVLIQIGGIGLMTVVVMFALISGKRVTLSQRMIIRDTFNLEGPQGMVRLVQYIFQFTIITEAVTAVIIAIRLSFDYPIVEAVFQGIFLSISAFCNAGFDTFGEAGISLYRDDIIVNIVLIVIIIVGGIGFPVLIDMRKAAERVFVEKRRFKKVVHGLEFHTKIALSMSIFLLVVPSVFFFLAENNNINTIGGFSLKDKVIASIFQSATMRTAGFVTIDQEQMTITSKVISMLLMFIGGSPSGTAGGVKTVTIGILLAAVYSVIKGYDSVRLFGRKISYETVQKALTVFFLGQAAVIVSTILLSVSEAGRDLSFYDVFHLAVSAFSTTGTAQAATQGLTTTGKYILIVIMVLGRLGPITVTAAITEITSHTKNHFDYPEGRIIIG